MVHPVLHSTRSIVWYTAIWFLIGVVYTVVLNHFYGFSHLISIADAFVYFTLFGGIAVGIWYPVTYNAIDSKQTSDLLMNHAGLATISLLFWFYAGHFILTTIFSAEVEYIAFLNLSLPWRLSFGLFLYSVTVLVYYLDISFQNLREKTRNEAELKTLVKETELTMLKSQINPHFLFNSLNSISSLTITNPSKAQEMIIKLSEFLRHSIHHTDHHKDKLHVELEHIVRYLEIEKVRFGDRLRYVFTINPECQKIEIPCMLLQPLFENAIKHGVYESIDEITIQFVCEPNELGTKITITNNFDPEAPPRKGNQMGIKNISSRLKLIYQYDNLLKIKKTKDTFTVEIIIPKA